MECGRNESVLSDRRLTDLEIFAIIKFDISHITNKEE